MRLYRVYNVKIKKAVSDANRLSVDNEDKLVIIDQLYWQNEDGDFDKSPNK